MTDVQHGRALEERRIERALQELDSQLALRVSRIEVEMERRGLQNSDARRQAICEARLEYLNQAILQRMKIRKEAVRSCPELGSVTELKTFADRIEADIAGLRAECQKASVIVPPEVFAELRAKVREGIAAIQREAPMELPMKPKLPGISLSVSSGSTTKVKEGIPIEGGTRGTLAAASSDAARRSLDRLGAASEKVKEAIADLEARNRELAGALCRLAAVIHDAAPLGEERIVYLEQVQFVAEQAARVSVLRRVSVVKGILVALQAGLEDRPTLAEALRPATSLAASHFGIAAGTRQAR